MKILKSYNSVYNVFFNGSSLINKNELSLTFFDQNNYYENDEIIILKNFNRFLLSLDDLGLRSEIKIKTIKTINQVIPLGSADLKNILNLYVILITEKKEENKIGLLIGNHEKLGYILLGLWPHNPYKIFKNENEINDILNEMIQTTNNKYKNILIIS